MPSRDAAGSIEDPVLARSPSSAARARLRRGVELTGIPIVTDTGCTDIGKTMKFALDRRLLRTWLICIPASRYLGKTQQNQLRMVKYCGSETPSLGCQWGVFLCFSVTTG